MVRLASLALLRKVTNEILMPVVQWRVVKSRNTANGFRLQFTFDPSLDEDSYGSVIKNDGSKRFFTNMADVLPVLEPGIPTPTIEYRPDLRNEIG